ncbi:MAG: TPM domain-containing protein [Bacteroidetes bacterium]|nr:TPM domain-containing protein [Bacteroidota bacterium]
MLRVIDSCANASSNHLNQNIRIRGGLLSVLISKVDAVMAKCKNCIITLILILAVGCLSEPPILKPDWIVDQANVLDPQDENDLINRLSDFYDSTSVAVVGITLESVGDLTVESFAQSLYQSWEVGNTETHNGIIVLLLIEDQLVHIEVGSGIAQEVFTSQALDSVEIIMADLFANGDFRRGFESGFDLLMRRVNSVSWEIAYTSLGHTLRDSIGSLNQIISTEGVIIGFDEDEVIVQDSDGIEARLIVPADSPVLSINDVIGFTGRIDENDPLVIRVLNLDVDYAF